MEGEGSLTYSVELNREQLNCMRCLDKQCVRNPHQSVLFEFRRKSAWMHFGKQVMC